MKNNSQDLFSKQELFNSVLGKYDHTRFVVYSGMHPNKELVKVTLKHEFMHHHLNVSTSYGLLINQIAKQIKDGVEARPNTDILELLVNNCNIVHEMLATYVSLVYHENSVIQLPPFYQTCFQNMRDIVEPIFENNFMREQYAIAISRLSMMNTVFSSYQEWEGNNYDLLSHLTTLLSDNRECPNTRLETISSALRSISARDIQNGMEDWWPGSDATLYFECESEQDLLTYFKGNRNDYINSLRNFNLSLLNALFELLKPTFPDLESNYSDYMMDRVASDHGSRMLFGGYDGLANGIDIPLYSALEQCDQKIQIFIGEVLSETLRANPKKLGKMIEISHQKLKAIFPFIQVSNSDSHQNIQIYLTNSERKDDNPVLKRYSLQDNESLAITLLGIQSVTIIEEEDLLAIKQDINLLPTQIRWFLARPTFAYVNRNPIEFVESFLRANYSIKWGSFGIAWNNGIITPETDVKICLYWIDNYPIPFFHLANSIMASGLSVFTEDFIKNQDKLKILTLKECQEKVGQGILPLLVDHPILNYYLTGTSPKID